MRSFYHALGFGRFVADYRRHIRTPITLDEARNTVRQRVAEKEQRFLDVAKTSIFRNPESPYLPLFKEAGCDYADLEQIVTGNGLKPALEHLRRSGIYFTFEEFKGRKMVVRGGNEFPIKPRAFNNSALKNTFSGQSGGSTGRPTQVFINMEHIRSVALAPLISANMHGLLDKPWGMWLGVLPDPTGSFNLLRQARWGRYPSGWFTPPTAKEASWRHRLFTDSMVSLGRLFGAPLPYPQPLALGQEAVAVRWIVENLVAKGGGAFYGHPSKALRICLAAKDLGISLEGVTFIMGGEPVTTGKIRGIQSAGADYLPRYAFSEHGAVGEACPDCTHEDQVHVFDDALAVIQADREIPGTGRTVGSFHFTSLMPTTPKVLLNVEADDFGVLEERRCTCEWGLLGFTTILRNIRSFSKLTAEGTTLIGTDLERILETELPDRFGGGPLDYQLVEEEDEKGFTRLNLRIHPRVSLNNEQEIPAYLLKSGGPSTSILNEAAALKVIRKEPILTGRGKFMPLQLLGTSRSTV